MLLRPLGDHRVELGVHGGQGDITNSAHAQTDVYRIAVFVSSGFSLTACVRAVPSGAANRFLRAPYRYFTAPVFTVGHHPDNFLAQHIAFAFNPALEPIGNLGIQRAARHFSITQGSLDILAD